MIQDIARTHVLMYVCIRIIYYISRCYSYHMNSIAAKRKKRRQPGHIVCIQNTFNITGRHHNSSMKMESGKMCITLTHTIRIRICCSVEEFSVLICKIRRMNIIILCFVMCYVPMGKLYNIYNCHRFDRTVCC